MAKITKARNKEIALHTKVSKELAEQVRSMSASMDMSVSGFIRHAIKAALREAGKESTPIPFARRAGAARLSD